MVKTIRRSSKRSRSPDAIDRHVGERLRLRRKTLGISQEQVAKTLDIAFQQVQKYEKGSNRISAGRLYHLAEFLDVPIAYFFEDAPGEEKKRSNGDSVHPETLTRKETERVLAAFGSIPDETVRQQLVDFMRTLGRQSH